ncbi:putative peptidoglycan lipid II flippase [Pseudoclavibacter chungangensis]|uniref:murein biosynthesis integral membrane protein MurJ n=1 Tax=Pseudoclavibacter chungangensis TaxID=587635 RepID=UPI0017DCB579|nr:murein biosynthesis integral membrane protein MurJ [Pseudoclavibacter chungangensis]NYJ68352.1 putative peptidoglycan lipid II flippase [Pseudoclavibacter chungangensis]
MAGGGIGRASALLASGTMVSRVLGFVKAIILANTIGIVGSASADAFQNAMQLPSNIYSIIAGGMLSAVLIPQVVRAARHEDGGQSYINRLVTLAIVVLGGLTVVATLAVPLISMIYGASLDPANLALVVAFGFWCMPQVFFYGLYAVLGEILNARGMFGPFTWAPVINNVVSIVGLFAFSAIFGADPSGTRPVEAWTPDMVAFLGGTTTLGVAIQAMVLFLFWRRVGLRYRPDFHFRGTGLGRAGKLASWTFGMLLITQSAGIVETIVLNIAFGQAASVAAFSNAFLIFALPHAVVAVSIATAYFTRMSEAASESRMADYVRDFSGGARLIGLFIVFAALGIAVISPAFARIFESTQTGVDSLAIVLCCFLLGLVPFCGLFLVQRAFYALEDTRSQFWVFLSTLPVHVFLMAMASTLPVEFIAAGLALAQTVMSAVRLSILFTLLRRRVGGVDAARIVRSYTVYGVAAVAAALVGVGLMWLLGAYDHEGFARSGLVNALVACAVGGTVMAIVYVVVLAVMRSSDLRDALAPVLRRFGKGRAASVEEIEPEPAEIDWSAGPATELIQVEDLPQAPEPPTDPVGVPSRPTPEELEVAAQRAARVSEREEHAYAGAWSMQGATGDLTTAGIILPMHATSTTGPRTRRERRELEARAAAALQARRIAAERARAAAERAGRPPHETDGPGGPVGAPWPGAAGDAQAVPDAHAEHRTPSASDGARQLPERWRNAPPADPTSAQRLQRTPTERPARRTPPSGTAPQPERRARETPDSSAHPPTQRFAAAPPAAAEGRAAHPTNGSERRTEPPATPRPQDRTPPRRTPPPTVDPDDGESGQDLLASWFGDDD